MARVFTTPAGERFVDWTDYAAAMRAGGHALPQDAHERRLDRLPLQPILPDLPRGFTLNPRPRPTRAEQRAAAADAALERLGIGGGRRRR